MSQWEEPKPYRIISEPSWQIQKLHRGEWVTVYYCKSKASAERKLALLHTRLAEWLAMTPEERISSILRHA